MYRRLNRLLAILAFLLMLLIIPALCRAETAERSLTFGLWTQHYGGDHTEGLDNHLVSLEWDGWTGAFFKNSYGNETGFYAYTWHTDKFKFHNEWYIQGNVGAGVLLGYGEKHPLHFGALSPGVYPTVNLGKSEHSIGLGVMPTFWWLSYRVEF